jgi:hypothetical protein
MHNLRYLVFGVVRPGMLRWSLQKISPVVTQGRPTFAEHQVSATSCIRPQAVALNPASFSAATGLFGQV